MIRVLNVISGLNNAGTEAVVMNYYRNIDRDKIQFDFLVLDETENLYYEEEICQLGGKIFKIPPFRKHPVKNILARRKFFKQHKYEIVEVHAPSATRYAFCKSAKKSGAQKVIFHIHNTCFKKGLIIRHARKQLMKYCDETVTCSQMAAISVLGHEADKVVYNAIDCTQYLFRSELREKVRHFYNIPDTTIVLGHVGRFSEQKNHKFLLDLMTELLKVHNGYVLLLKGFGELENSLRKQIECAGIKNHVIFVGEEFSAKEIYSAFDFFVFPSLWEGLSVVIIESQVNGLIPIVSPATSREADIGTGLVCLDLNLSVWKKYILENGLSLRNNCYDEVRENNYDIKVAARQREKDYLNGSAN